MDSRQVRSGVTLTQQVDENNLHAENDETHPIK